MGYHLVDISLNNREFQRAYLPSDLFLQLSAPLNSVMEIDLASGVSITCVANVCEEGKSAHCEVSCNVIQPENLPLPHLVDGGFEFTSSAISVHRISLPRCVNATEVELNVICVEVDQVLTYRTRPGQVLKFLQVFLKDVFVSRGSVVRLQQNPLAKNLGLAAVTVKRLKSSIEETACGKTVFRISDETAISLWNVVSIQRLIAESPGAKQASFGGLGHQQIQLQNILVNANKSDNFLKGFLVIGPPGCGKSSLLDSMFLKNRIVVCKVNCCDLRRPSSGDSEKLLRNLFERGKLHCQEGPTAILFEDVDVIGGCTKAANSNQVRIITQLANLMDDLHSRNDKLIVGGTTSDVTCLDASLRRPGRFTHEIFIGVPNLEERKDILRHLTNSNVELQEENLLSIMAESTPGYVGIDLANLVKRVKTSLPSSNLAQYLVKQSVKFLPSSELRSGIGVVDVKETNWDDIGGLESVKRELEMAVVWPMKYREKFKLMDVKRPKGLLLYGPPGCGKTSIVRAMASLTKSTFLYVSAASIFSPFVGDSEKAVAEVFQKARAGSPSILFIDEIDSLVSTRMGKSTCGVQEKVLSVILNEMDGIGGVGLSENGGNTKFSQTVDDRLLKATDDEDAADADARHIPRSDGEVMLVGATNRPDLLDPALCRPGRLDRHVFVSAPDEASRLSILRKCTFQTSLSKDVDLLELSRRTELYSGADLKNLCREAALDAITLNGVQAVSHVSMLNFQHCLDKTRPTLTYQMLEQYRSFNC